MKKPIHKGAMELSSNGKNEYIRYCDPKVVLQLFLHGLKCKQSKEQAIPLSVHWVVRPTTELLNLQERLECFQLRSIHITKPKIKKNPQSKQKQQNPVNGICLVYYSHFKV